MSPCSTLDRESLQQLLAAAFAVQQSRMDTQSLLAIIQIQRRMAATDLDVDETLSLVVSYTQNVADAAGVAIGVLEGHQLVYRAGIGSAAAFLGRHVMATLSVGSDTGASREILRVENAQTDARIEAAICRQFGAESLLIMPIYRGQTMAGVLEVLFSEAHAFQDREVRAYRLIGGMVGEALEHAAHRDQAKASAAEPFTVPNGVDPPLSQIQMQALPGDDLSVPEAEGKQAIYQSWEVAPALAGNLPTFWRLPGMAAVIRQGVNRVPRRVSQWSAVVAVVVAVVIVGWTALSVHRSASTAVPVLRPSNGAEQNVTSGSDAALTTSTSQLLTVTTAAQTRKNHRSAFRRVQVAENEIDDVADDVTVRHFIYSPAQRLKAGYNQVEFGKDVTVRYFASNGATVPATTPVSSGAQPVIRTLPEPGKPVTRKLAR